MIGIIWIIGYSVGIMMYFFGKNANTMFENTPIPGKRDEMGFVKGGAF